MAEAPAARATTLEALAKTVAALAAVIAALGALLKALDSLNWEILLSPFSALAFALLFAGTVLFYRHQRRDAPSRIADETQLRLRATDRKSLKGREDDIHRLIPLISTRSLFFLEGESGVGKSALVLHGLIPAIREDPSRHALHLSLWRMGARDESVAKALLMSLPGDESGPVAPGASLEDRLRAALKAQKKQRPVVVFFDQFDDYVVENLKAFQESNGTLMTPDRVCEVSPSWQAIRAMIREQLITAVFVTRTDEFSRLDLVRFEATHTPMERIERIRGSAMKEILDGISVHNPGGGWEQLKERIVDDTRGYLLPQQIKLILGGLRFLRPLTERQYERDGGATGLEALNVKGLARVAAEEADVALHDVLLLLGRMVNPDQRTLDSIELPSGRSGERLTRAFERLEREEIARPTKNGRWTLFHDYLCRSVRLIRLSFDRPASLRIALRRAYEAWTRDRWGRISLLWRGVSVADQIRYWRAGETVHGADERRIRGFVVRSAGVSALKGAVLFAVIYGGFTVAQRAVIRYVMSAEVSALEGDTPHAARMMASYWARDGLNYLIGALGDPQLWHNVPDAERGRRIRNFAEYMKGHGPSLIGEFCARAVPADDASPLVAVHTLLCGLSPARQAHFVAGPQRAAQDFYAAAAGKFGRNELVVRTMIRAAVMGIDDFIGPLEWVTRLACEGKLPLGRGADASEYRESMGALAKDLVIASRKMPWHDDLRTRLIPRVRGFLADAPDEAFLVTCSRVYLYLHDRGRVQSDQEIRDPESAHLLWDRLRGLLESRGGRQLERASVELISRIADGLRGSARLDLIERFLDLRRSSRVPAIREFVETFLPEVSLEDLGPLERRILYCNVLGELGTSTEPYPMYKLHDWVHALKAPCDPLLEDRVIAHVASLERDAKLVASKILFQTVFIGVASGAGLGPTERRELATRAIAALKVIISDAVQLKKFKRDLADIVGRLVAEAFSPDDMCELLSALRVYTESTVLVEVRDLVRNRVTGMGHECVEDGESRPVAKQRPRRAEALSDPARTGP